MFFVYDAHQHGIVFALGAGAENDDFAGRERIRLFGRNHRFFVEIHEADFFGDFDVGFHGVAFNGHLTAMAFGDQNHLLQAIDHGREGGGDDALVGMGGEEFVEIAFNNRFGNGMAFAFGTGGVGVED